MIRNSFFLGLVVLILSSCSVKEFETGVHHAGKDVIKLFEVRE